MGLAAGDRKQVGGGLRIEVHIGGSGIDRRRLNGPIPLPPKYPYFMLASGGEITQIQGISVTAEGIEATDGYLNPIRLTGLYQAARPMLLSPIQAEQALLEITLVQIEHEYLALRFLKQEAVSSKDCF